LPGDQKETAEPEAAGKVAGRKHLRWVNGQNENNSEGVVAAGRRMGCNAFSIDEFFRDGFPG